MSEEASNAVATTLRSETVESVVDTFPLATPATVVTPTIVTSDVLTLTTFAKIGSVEEERSEYSSKLFSFILPGNNGFALVTVLTPPEKPLIEAAPIVNCGDCTTLALNVLIPTIFAPFVPAATPVLE